MTCVLQHGKAPGFQLYRVLYAVKTTSHGTGWIVWMQVQKKVHISYKGMATKANVRNLVISFFDGWATLVLSLYLHFRITLQHNQWILGWMSCSVPRSLRLVTGGIYKWGIVETWKHRLVEIEVGPLLRCSQRHGSCSGWWILLKACYVQKLEDNIIRFGSFTWVFGLLGYGILSLFLLNRDHTFVMNENIFYIKCDTQCLFVSEKCHNPRQIQCIMFEIKLCFIEQVN